MPFDYNLPTPPCARGRFCEVETRSGICPCGEDNSLAAELREHAEDLYLIQQAEEIDWEFRT